MVEKNDLRMMPRTRQLVEKTDPRMMPRTKQLQRRMT
jgi:hypothetical protein